MRPLRVGDPSEYSIETSGIHHHFHHGGPGANRPATCTATRGSHEPAPASHRVDPSERSDSNGSQARRAKLMRTWRQFDWAILNCVIVSVPSDKRRVAFL